MTKDEALKLALEALEGVLDDAPKVLEASIAGGLYEVIQCRDAINAIKEALAQPEQEPVAWIEHEWSGSGLKHLHFDRREPSVRDEVMNPVWTPLYTTPQPTQRKPLTREQVKAIMAPDYNTATMQERADFMIGFRAAEAAHGIKENT